jgi:hypothetical protein
MSVMYRIICRKLLVLIRLAIIVSLAGYSFSNAAAAMHSGPSADNQASVSFQLMDQVDAKMASHGNYDDLLADNEVSKPVDQDCGNDFCTGFVLTAFHDASGGPVVSAAREFVDEPGVCGQIPGLHRPPKI